MLLILTQLSSQPLHATSTSSTFSWILLPQFYNAVVLGWLQIPATLPFGSEAYASLPESEKWLLWPREMLDVIMCQFPGSGFKSPAVSTSCSLENSLWEPWASMKEVLLLCWRDHMESLREGHRPSWVQCFQFTTKAQRHVRAVWPSRP